MDHVLVESIKPSDYGSQTTDKNKIAVEANALLRSWCENNSRLHFIDSWSALYRDIIDSSQSVPMALADGTLTAGQPDNEQGNAAYRVQFNTAGAGGASYYYKGDNPVTIGENYRWQIWLKSNTGADQITSLNYYDGAHHRSEITVTPQWQQFTLDFTATQATVNVYVDNRSPNANATDIIAYKPQFDVSPLYLAAGNSYDDIHLTAQGAWRASEAYLPMVTKLVGLGSSIDGIANTLLANPSLAGTSGSTNSGTSGDVADGWQATYSGGTTDIARVFSKTSSNNQRVVITAGVGAGADEITYFQQTLASVFVPGEVYRAHAALKVNSIERGYWVGMQVIQRDSGGSIIHNASDYDRRDENALLDGAAMTGASLQFQPMDVIIDANTVSIDIRIAMGVSAGGEATSMDIEIEQVMLELVTLSLLEELGDTLIFWMNPDAQDAFTYNQNGIVSQINDQSYFGNHAVLVDGFDGASYNPSAAEAGNLPALQNAGANADTTQLGYRFPHALSVTSPRSMIAVARGDNSIVEPGSESASNALFAASNGVDTGDSLGAFRQVRNEQHRHQMTGYAYGSSFTNSTLDALRSYWLRYDGVNIDGGVNPTVSEGPAIADTTGLVQDSYGYVFADGDSTNSYLGWARDLLMFDSALTDTQLAAVLLYVREKSNVTAD